MVKKFKLYFDGKDYRLPQDLLGKVDIPEKPDDDPNVDFKPQKITYEIQNTKGDKS